MERLLECYNCGKHMATLRDARVRKGIVVLCQPCHEWMNKKDRPDMPEFLKGLFRV